MATATDKKNQLDSILDGYEKSLGLCAILPDTSYADVENYLNIQRDQLEKLDTSACAEISYRLSAFAFHLSRAYNREISRVNWANSLIEEVIAGELNSYQGYGYKEKAPQAIKGNEYAKKLNEISRYAKQRSDRIGYLSNHLQKMCEALDKLSYTKREKK